MRIVSTFAAMGVFALSMGGAAAQTPPADAEQPADPGAETMVRVCSACHAPDVVVGLQYDRQGWEDLVRSMQDRGALASEEEVTQIVDFLAANFGPEQTGTPAPAAPDQ